MSDYGHRRETSPDAVYFYNEAAKAETLEAAVVRLPSKPRRHDQSRFQGTTFSTAEGLEEGAERL